LKKQIRALIVTEKCSPIGMQRDGGARVVDSLTQSLGSDLAIMQFGEVENGRATWRFDYPYLLKNRFERRMANAAFIAEKVAAVASDFTHILFIHVSMQFAYLAQEEEISTWTLPMFLTPSYIASGETVPEKYFQMEKAALAATQNILTPSYLEKGQLTDVYSIPEEKIHVVPRGVDARYLKPILREPNTPLRVCSIGSIKPQKNILGLLSLFKKIEEKYPSSTLKIIGPVQDEKYGDRVMSEIHHLGIQNQVKLTGHIPKESLYQEIDMEHIHFSASTCETFGRSIFETLASGMPNIAFKKDNAAAEFLNDLPYVKFVQSEDQALIEIEGMLKNLAALSEMATEIGTLYNDDALSELLAAKILGREILAISDFDGTLYHKNDPERTKRCMNAFSQFSKKVLCSARPLCDLQIEIKKYKIEVDWIISYSGSLVSKGDGTPLFSVPLQPKEINTLEKRIPSSRRIEYGSETLQIASDHLPEEELLGFRTEIYENQAFISPWRASKFRSSHKLLKSINWRGQVVAFGDGPYDRELLHYFDGTLIGSKVHYPTRKKQEIAYV